MIIDPYVRALRVSGLLRRLLIGAVLLLLPISQRALFAQQAPPGEDWSQSYPSPNMYAPESDYGQESYSAPQAYLQQQMVRQPLGTEQLEQLVAPVALYPDALLAQVLTAATYPDQVSYVDQWVRAQGGAPPEEIAAGADQTNWDPSLKALTAFPQVLALMAQNLPWTTDLGNAYYNQPQDVLGAVQAMRARAQAAGNLQSSPQEAVSYSQGNIELAPANQNMVYVPSYNPWSVYGQSVSPYPGFSLLGTISQFLGSSPVSYGLGILMNVFNHTPWGWLSWGLSWLTQSVLFQHNGYFSHSATVVDWGFPHGGPRAFRGYGRRGFARVSEGFHENRAFGHGYQPRGGWYGRNSLVARNDFRPAGRQAWYGGSRGAYRSGMYGRTAQFNGVRAGSIYGRPGMAYRQPQSPYRGSGFGHPVYHGPAEGFRSAGPRTSFAGGYSGKPNRSGGFHLFGGGHPSRSFGGGSHGPKFGGGHGMFGGHSGGHGGGHGGGHSHGHHH